MSDDPFGHAIKATLEHLQKSHADGSFGPSELPSIDADLLAQVRSGRLFAFTHADEQGQVDQAKLGILRQLEGAGLIEPAGYQRFRLTAAGRQTGAELAK